MSHTTTVTSIKINSIAALQDAVAELREQGIRISLVPDAAPRAYYANQQGMGPAPYVLRLEGAPYDIGLYGSEESGYEARTDLWAGHVQRLLGVEGDSTPQGALGKLYQTYAVCAVVREAQSQGYSVSRERGASGDVVLSITGM